MKKKRWVKTVINNTLGGKIIYGFGKEGSNAFFTMDYAKDAPPWYELTYIGPKGTFTKRLYATEIMKLTPEATIANIWKFITDYYKEHV